MTTPKEKLQHMVDDGVITIDADGTIKLTESAWLRMTTPPEKVAHSKPTPPARNGKHGRY